MIASNLGQVIALGRTSRRWSRQLGATEKKILAIFRELGADLGSKDVLELVPQFKRHARPMQSVCITLARLVSRGYLNRTGGRKGYTYTLCSPLGLDLLGLLP